MVIKKTLAASPKSKKISIWFLRILLGVLFISTSLMKLSGQPMMLHEFDQIGLGQWFRILTGAMELAGGIAVLVPAVSRYGAIALLGVDVGAFTAQITVLHQDWIHTIVIGIMLATVIFLQGGLRDFGSAR